MNWSGAALSADFIAVRVEAENFTSKSDRWALTTPDFTPDVQPDPDPPHNDSASGNANLELLPDTRVTHEDEVFNGGLDGNFWGAPGGGPRIDYNVNVPEAGRYFVYVKTFSTNTEDNGIHVGVNGNLPESGRRIQICSKHNWFWTSGQRTDDNHCGVTKTIWLDFPAAGVNTITFFAREDGFEIDQFLLLKETHDGSLDCFPTFNDKIRCKDTPAPEPVTPIVQAGADVEIDINAIGSVHFVNDTIEYQVRVTNNSADNSATNSRTTIDLPAGLEFNASAECTSATSVVSCEFGDIAAASSATFSFTVIAQSEGNHRVDAQVVADEDDDNSANNTDSASINAQFNIPDFEAAITMAQRSNASAIGGVNQYAVTITNNGLQATDSATLRVTPGAGISLQAGQSCNPECTVPSLATGQSTVITFNTVATQSGITTVTAELILAGDANTADNIATLSETVVGAGVAINQNNQIVIEAEAFNGSSVAATDNAPQWFIVNENFTSLPMSLDPDNAAYQSVSGSAYVELLPDLRIDDSSASISGASNFVSGGIGATLSYDVYFAQAGNYNVYARVRPNNNQDASVHVGLNNDWPASSTSVSVCNPDGNWQWTNNLTDTTGCSTSSTATIAVAAPGIHTLMISQDTDGLELDKLILSQDVLADLTGNGPASTAIDPSNATDISVETALSTEQVSAGEPATYTVSLTNRGNTTAMGLTVTISGLITEPLQPTVFDSCTINGTNTVCSLLELEDSQQVSETFAINTTEPSNIGLSATVSAIQRDENRENNTSVNILSINTDSSPDNNQVAKVENSSGGGGGSMSLWFLLSALLLLVPGTVVRYHTVMFKQMRAAIAPESRNR